MVQRLGLGLGVSRDQGLGLDTSTSALVARFSTPPTETRKLQIDRFIKSLKATGVWQLLDALYVMAAGDAQAAQRNWLADQFNLTVTNAPVFTADRGYQGAVGDRLSTGYNVASGGGKLLLDSASLFCWSLSDIAAAGGDIGASPTPSVFNVSVRRATGEIDAEINNASSGNLRVAVPNALGLSLCSRLGATTTAIYRNAGLVKAGNVASTVLTNSVLTLLTADAASYPGRQLSIGGFGAGMTAQNVADLHAACNTYLTAVGAV